MSDLLHGRTHDTTKPSSLCCTSFQWAAASSISRVTNPQPASIVSRKPIGPPSTSSASETVSSTSRSTGIAVACLAFPIPRIQDLLASCELDLSCSAHGEFFEMCSILALDM